MSEITFKTKRNFCISKQPCNVPLNIEHQIMNHYVTIAMVIFSRVKITCFHVKAHLVFHWCKDKKSFRSGFRIHCDNQI